MNLHLLELFCQVVDTGSFSVTANSRFVSRSAVSTQIHRLEEDLGVPLLERSQGRWRPTAAGSAVYHRSQSILNQQDLMRAELQAYQSGKMPLIVGASPTGVLTMVAEALMRFQQSHPLVSVQVDVDAPKTLFEKLEQDIIRLVFEWGPTSRHTLNCSILAACKFPVVVSPQHSIAGKRHLSSDQFRQQTLYCLRHGPQTISPVEEALMASHNYPQFHSRLPSVDAIKTMVKAGCGVTVLSRASLQEELSLGLLSEITVQGFELERPLLGMWRMAHPLSLLEQAFIDAVQAVALDRGLSPYSSEKG